MEFGDMKLHYLQLIGIFIYSYSGLFWSIECNFEPLSNSQYHLILKCFSRSSLHFRNNDQTKKYKNTHSSFFISSRCFFEKAEQQKKTYFLFLADSSFLGHITFHTHLFLVSVHKVAEYVTLVLPLLHGTDTYKPPSNELFLFWRSAVLVTSSHVADGTVLLCSRPHKLWSGFGISTEEMKNVKAWNAPNLIFNFNKDL